MTIKECRAKNCAYVSSKRNRRNCGVTDCSRYESYFEKRRTEEEDEEFDDCEDEFSENLNPCKCGSIDINLFTSTDEGKCEQYKFVCNHCGHNAIGINETIAIENWNVSTKTDKPIKNEDLDKLLDFLTSNKVDFNVMIRCFNFWSGLSSEERANFIDMYQQGNLKGKGGWY